MQDRVELKSITVLRLKVSSSSAELMPIAEECRRGRNAAAEDWLLRQRGKPESEKQKKQSTRKSARNPDGKPQSLSESTKIYHAVTASVPELGTTQASMLAAQLNSHLGAKLDWRRGKTEDGKQPRRRDAILNYEDRPPFFTSLEIPVHNNQVAISCGERLTVTIRSPMRGAKSVELELSLRDIPPATQLLLRDIADGKKKLADSKLLYKETKGEWYWHLPVAFIQERLSEVSVTLSPQVGKLDGGKQNDRPFRLELPKGRDWFIGDGRYLKSQVARLTGLRKQIGWRYRQRMDAGHGRKKVDKAVRRRRQQQKNVVAEVHRRAIRDVVRQCVRAKAGVLIYREPSLPLRKRCWFETNGLEWDWTSFVGNLKNACAKQGIQVVVKQLKWKDAIGEKQDAA